MKKFVQLSATDSIEPEKESDVMRPYAVAKHFSDLYIENSGLNYTIVHQAHFKMMKELAKLKLN